MKINTKPFEELFINLQNVAQNEYGNVLRNHVAELKFQTMADFMQELIKIAEAVNAIIPEKKENELLSCPWCGPNPESGCFPELIYVKDKNCGNHWLVYCSDCGAAPNHYVKSESEAISVWNTRTK